MGKVWLAATLKGWTAELTNTILKSELLLGVGANEALNAQVNP